MNEENIDKLAPKGLTVKIFKSKKGETMIIDLEGRVAEGFEDIIPDEEWYMPFNDFNPIKIEIGEKVVKTRSVHTLMCGHLKFR